MIESKHIQAVVTSRRDISSDLWVVRLRPQEKLSFVPGQYVTVALPQGDRLIERPYSVASSPSDDELEFFLELVPGGHLTPHLYDIPAGGEVLLRRLAKGRFLLDDKSGHPRHFMVATVTGVAPFVSMLRNLKEWERCGEAVPYQIVLLHGASISRELAYCEELSNLARECEWFRYIPTVSRLWLDRGWGGEIGRAEDILRKYLDTLGFTSADTTAYACGNPVMIENVKAILQRAGFPAEFVKQEVYWVAEKGE
ncbi:MAG TPA: FAD-binding oxidoreductase [Bryobacteraceae bacterium]|nr:FAD-binding oxidoreductase [Bryobacteraceae bacterium]